MDHIIDIFILEASKYNNWDAIMQYKWLYNSNLTDEELLKKLQDIYYN